jgi:GT2 family glycosyltransferase
VQRPASAPDDRRDSPAAPPEIAIVVPTRNRPDSLVHCLEALERQTAASLEVIVVDDGSEDPERVAAVVASSPSARLIRRRNGSGPAAARDAGACEARGEVVAYTDDDCEAAPDWVEGLLAGFERGADAVAGTTVDASRGNPFDAASQLIVNFLVERSTTGGGRTHFAPSSNLACRADVLRAVPFDASFRGFGEDRDWCARLVAAGYSLVLEPAAVVEHRQGLGLVRFWRKHVAYGRGAYDFRRVGPTSQRFEPIGFYAALIRRGLAAGPAVGLLVALAQVATAVGLCRQALAHRSRR